MSVTLIAKRVRHCHDFQLRQTLSIRKIKLTVVFRVLIPLLWGIRD